MGTALVLRMGAQAADQDLIRAFSRFQQLRNLRPRTVAARRSALRLFCAFAGGCLLRTDHKVIEAWLDSRPLSAKSRADYISYLHSFYEWAIREELTDTDPTVRIPRPKVNKHLPRPISEGNLSMAFGMADVRMLAMLALAAYAGLRCCEIANLDVADLVWGAVPIIVIREGKGDKDRIVPLGHRVQLALRAYGLPQRGPVFHRQDGLPYAAGTISRYINRHLRSCGLQETAHQLRHRYGTRFYAESKDIMLTKEMMGHSSVATTQGYVAFSPDAAAKVVELL